MPRKGENIYKRKDGRWEGRYIGCYDENHKAKYVYIYGKTYTEVKQKLAIERGRQKQHVPAEKKQITYGEVLALWLHSTKTSIKESTYARYAHLINSHIKPQLGDYKLSMLSTEIIEDFIENQLVEGQLDRTGGLAPKTVIDLLAIVKSTIGYAQYKGFPVICNLSRLSVKRKDKEMRVLTPLERESLIGILMEDMDSFKFGVFLALYTGIRIGELCALQWKDIDFARATLKVRKTIQRIQNTDSHATSKTKIVISEPKSKSSIREIPLTSSIMEIAWKFVSFPDSYILTGTGRYIEPRTMGLSIIYMGGFIAVRDLKTESSLSVMPFFDAKMPIADDKSKQYFVNTPRILKSLDSGEIEVDAPPSPFSADETPVILTLGPSLTMSLVMLASIGVSITNAISGGELSSLIASGTMAGGMLLGSLLWPSLLRSYQKRRTLAEERHRKSRYSAYIADVEKTFITKRDRNVRVLNDYLSPSPEVLCSFLDNENNRLRLWVTVYFIVRPSSIFKICGSILHIVQTLVITVCNDCLALFLKLFQVVNNTATKKRVPIF